MTEYELLGMNGFKRALYKINKSVKAFPAAFKNVFVSSGKKIGALSKNTGGRIKELLDAFIKGNIGNKLSFFIMGLGNMFNGQIVKGFIFLSSQVAFFFYITGFGWQYIKDIGTLGTNVGTEVFDEELEIFVYTQPDNSMKILLFGVFSIILALAFLGIYFTSVKDGYRAHVMRKNGRRPLRITEEFRDLFDKNFHKTLLAAPTLMVSAFTIIPIVFMVLIAFTNFDKSHQPPGNLFTWVGTINFKDLFWNDPMKSNTFISLLGWTLTWAVLATFSNYILGMILAFMINKKGIKLKRMWRTVFIVTAAVPQFVSLLLMSQLLTDQGSLNTILKEWGIIEKSIPFLTDATLARISVVVINIWVGIPYTMLITTGILMNIPDDLYESARIDGAGPIVTFTKITLPYMLFVTTPYLITQFVGNINNFNVIYLLTRGNPLSTDYFQAGKTDLLITWLYKQTVNEQNYNLASAIGILTFILVASMSLIVYNSSKSAKRESDFQ
jgi:arabinogalactan oligomer / maltooligosaccharide transport system permease protein